MAAVLPVVRVIGAGRNVGKTWLASRLIAELTARGHRVAAVKRSHHAAAPDKPGADTELFAQAGAGVVVFGAGDATVTRAPAAMHLAELVAPLSGAYDVVVVEGFRSDSLGARIEVSGGLARRASLTSMDGEPVLDVPMEKVDAIADALERLFGLCAAGPERLRAALRRAASAHGHRCPGLALGVRMAMAAAARLGFDLDRPPRELRLEVETARCATDALVALTGCTPGSGRLRVADQGKLAATFSLGEEAVRIAARPGLRQLAARIADGDASALAQEVAYRTLPDDLLVAMRAVRPLTVERVRGGFVLCAGCGEEVATARAAGTGDAARCLACAVAALAPSGVR